jgi:hypothetical protein
MSGCRAALPDAGTEVAFKLAVGSLTEDDRVHRRLARGAAPASTSLAVGGIAMMAASLGRVGLGLAGLLGASAGVLLGAVSATALTRVRSAAPPVAPN